MLRILFYCILVFFYIVVCALALALTALVLIMVIRFVQLIFEFIKRVIVIFRIKNINKIVFTDAKQLYCEVSEKTGYSKGYSARGIFYREYYKVRNVPNGYRLQLKVCFKNGKELIIHLNESSRLLKKLILIEEVEFIQNKNVKI